MIKTTTFLVITMQIAVCLLFRHLYLNIDEPQGTSGKNYQDASEENTKIILIIIDSLGYELATSQHFKFLTKQVSKHPDKAILLKSIADSPTMTYQRVYAMMTGEIMNHKTSGSRALNKQVMEDNILSQVHAHNKTTAYIGDELWSIYFPNFFNQSYIGKWQSLNDNYTIDNAVFANLLLYYKQQKNDLTIGHLLGVDRIGHNYDSQHPEILNKLKLYDEYLLQVYNEMDQNTILIIMSDHGMKFTGGHGDDSSREKETFIFATKKSGQFNEMFQFSKDSILTVNQIDITPTLASILKIPIPFNNLGVLIPAFVNTESACIQNLNQVWNYVQLKQQLSNTYPTETFEQWAATISDLATCDSILPLLRDIQIHSQKHNNYYNVDKLQQTVNCGGFVALISVVLMIYSWLKILSNRQSKHNLKIEEVQSLTEANLELPRTNINQEYKIANKQQKRWNITLGISLFVYIQIELVYVQLSMMRMRREFDNLIAIILRCSIIYFIGIKHRNFNSFLQKFLYYTTFYLLVFGSAMICLNLDNYWLQWFPKSMFIYPIVYNIVNSTYLVSYVPCVVLHFILYRYQRLKQSITDIKAFTHVVLIAIELILIEYYVLQQHQEHPIIMVLIVASTMGLVFYFKDSIYWIMPIILISGKYSLLVYSVYLVSLWILLQLMPNNYQQQNIRVSSELFIIPLACLLTIMYWFCLGHRSTILTIDYHNVFYYTQDQVQAVLLWINLNGIFIVLALSLKSYLTYLSQAQIETKICLTQISVIRMNALITMCVFFYLRCFYTMIHCNQNLHHFLIPTDYAQKYYSDFRTFITIAVMTAVCI